MTLNRYFNRMLIIFTAILLIVVLSVGYWFVNRQFNRYFIGEHNDNIAKLIEQVEQALKADSEQLKKEKLFVLHEWLKDSGYQVNINDNSGAQIFTAGGYRKGGRHQSATVNSDDYTIKKDGQTIANLTISYAGNYNVSTAALALRNTIVAVIVVTALASIVAIVLVSRFMSRRIVEPINQASHKAQQLTHGQYQPSVPEQCGIAELDALNQSIDTMADTLSVQEKLRKRLVEQMGHEIKTPLAIVKGQLEAVKDGVIDWDDKRLNLVHGEIDELSRLVEGLEDMQTLTSSYENSQQITLDLTEFVKQMVARVKYVYNKRQLSLDCHLAPQLPLTTDPTKLKSLLMNLLINAQKYSVSGQTVSLEAQAVKDHITLVIANTRHGDVVLDIAKLGQIGYRGERQMVAGRGMGLYIAREMARHIGATLEFTVSENDFSAQLTLPNAR